MSGRKIRYSCVGYMRWLGERKKNQKVCFPNVKGVAIMDISMIVPQKFKIKLP